MIAYICIYLLYIWIPYELCGVCEKHMNNISTNEAFEELSRT